MVSGAAVARSWGDKVVEYMTDQLHFSSTDVQLLNPGWGINPMAFLVSSFSVTLLLAGIKETKRVTNIMSAAKVLLVASMCIYGFFFFHKENWTPLIPFGLPGTLRGSTSAFFGYVGYDEICCLAGEARNPRENLPKAILWVIAIVTILSMTASISLIGMQPFTNISDTSGFPSAFQWNGRVVAAQVFAVCLHSCNLVADVWGFGLLNQIFVHHYLFYPGWRSFDATNRCSCISFGSTKIAVCTLPRWPTCT